MREAAKGREEGPRLVLGWSPTTGTTPQQRCDIVSQVRQVHDLANAVTASIGNALGSDTIEGHREHRWQIAEISTGA